MKPAKRENIEEKTANCCIVIPIYKQFPNRDEIHSLRCCLKVFHNHDIFLVTHKSLEIKQYQDVYHRCRKQCKTEFFEETFFDGIAGYNRLMLSELFYERFSLYKHLLIYQLDAYVFRNELAKWCSTNYSYIGAPLPRDLTSAVETAHNKKSEDKITLKRVFNGGASLRKTADFIRAINNHKDIIQGWYDDGLNEDVIFSALFLNEEHPTEEEAREFSFDMFPKEDYERNSRQLPMMCHGWTKSVKENHVYNREFWLRYIWPTHYFCYRLSKYSRTLMNLLKCQHR